jgi:hypothetical protein
MAAASKAPFGKTQSFSGKTTTQGMNRVGSFSNSTASNQFKSTTSLAKAAANQYNDENRRTYAPLQNAKKSDSKPVQAAESSEYDFDIFVSSQTSSQQENILKSVDSHSHILDFFKPNKENAAPATQQKIDSDEELLEQDEEGISKLHIITDTITDVTELKSCEGNFERMMESPMPFDNTIKFLAKESSCEARVESSSEEEDDVEEEEEEDEETRKRIESDNILFNLVDFKDDCIK